MKPSTNSTRRSDMGGEEERDGIRTERRGGKEKKKGDAGDTKRCGERAIGTERRGCVRK